MKTNKNESGRSMVEMLGVLAIIGVLSVGGIAGYKMAMQQYLKNERLKLFSSIHTAVNSSLMNKNSSLYCCSIEGGGNQCESGSDWEVEQLNEICSYLDKECNIKDLLGYSDGRYQVIENSSDKDTRYLSWEYMTLNRPRASENCGPTGQFYMISMTFKNQQLCQDVYNTIVSSPLSEGLVGVNGHRNQSYCISDTDSDKVCTAWTSVPYYSFTLYYKMNGILQCIPE